MVVGSVASAAYGEPRTTLDVDVVADFRPDQVAPFCAAFPDDEFYVSPQAAREAVRAGHQFNVLHPASGNKADLMMPRTDAWGREQMSRRQRVQFFPDRDGYAARPDDVILAKMWYYREGGSEKHLRDVTGILKISGDQVDRDYVSHWAAQLGVSVVWDAVRRRLGEV
jgi:hypothetical protein